jgi:hypothetical protein
MLFVSADEHRALIMSLTPEQTATIDGPTEFEVADIRASLLAGDNLGAAGCTDLVPGNLKIDDQAAVEAGTLTVSFDGATVDLSLEGAASKAAAIEDVQFSDVFLAGAPG